MDIYRVVCSENQRLYPGKTFIDFMPAGTNRCENAVIHDSILKMRQMINPEVDSLTTGLLLYDFGDGNISLKYEKAYNYIIRRNQAYIKDKYENMIIERFKDMRAMGKEKTLDVSLSTLAVVYDFYKSDNTNSDSPRSAREAELRRKAEEYRQLQKRRQVSINNARTKDSPYSPSQIMAWKMAHYNGD